MFFVVFITFIFYSSKCAFEGFVGFERFIGGHNEVGNEEEEEWKPYLYHSVGMGNESHGDVTKTPCKYDIIDRTTN